MRKIFSCLALALSAFLLGASRAEDAPKLPDGVDALPKAMIDKMKDLLENAEKYRGLKCIHRLASGTLKEDALRTKMKMMFEEELPPVKMRPLEVAMKAFGLIPEKMDLNKYLPELLTSQVGGYYDPRRQYLVLVQRENGLLGKTMDEKLGKEQAAQLAQQMDDICMVHEMTHAIQDQHFNLQKFQIDNPLSDEAAARTALIEGDATLIMYNFAMKMKIEDLPFADSLLGWLLKDPMAMIDMQPDMPGAKEMKEAPPYFRDGMLFSYMQGYVFCISVRKAGGQELLDYAFMKDPPKSTEQILHPEKWHGKRDDPIEIVLPDFAAELPGWSKAAEGTMGELSVKILLTPALKSAEKAEAAAAGWGGDRYAVYEKNDARVLLWTTDWDTQKDAAEFASAAASLGEGWKIETAGPKRVTVTRNADAKATAALHKALGGAQMKEPENKRIDIADVKARAKTAQNEPAKTKSEGLDPEKLLNDPEVGKLLKNLQKKDNLDINEIVKDPAIQDLAKKLLDGLNDKKETPAENGGKKNDAGDIDLSKAFEKIGGKDGGDLMALAKAFAPDTSDGAISKNGREFSSASIGVKIALPSSAKDWSLMKPDIPMLLVQAVSPDTSANVTIAAQNMPLAMPIENLGPMLEMGLKMALKDYKVIKQGLIGEGEKKAYEYQVTGQRDGVSVQMLSRYYIRNGKMLVLTGSAGADKWQDHEKVLTEILDAVQLMTPKAAAPQK